jgi:hypothetical protein
MKLKEFKQQFDAIQLMKIFEIAVIDKRTGSEEYIIFDISIQGRRLVAQHEAMSAKQYRSKKIAFVSVAIDKDFSIDSHFEYLLEACNYVILESEYFELREE